MNLFRKILFILFFGLALPMQAVASNELAGKTIKSAILEQQLVLAKVELAKLVVASCFLAGLGIWTAIEAYRSGWPKAETPQEKQIISVLQEDLRKTAIHEAGHALMTLLTPCHHGLEAITIIPGEGYHGLTIRSARRFGHNLTETEMRTEVMISFAGMAAEELMYGTWDNGATQDLSNASEYVRFMVCHLGMSPKLGHVYYYYGGDNFPVFSQETARIIDEEVRRISEELYQETIALLRDNRDALNLLAANLLEKKTLTAAEVYQLLGMQQPVVNESNLISLECTA